MRRRPKLTIQVPRYEEGIRGLPDEAITVSNSQRGTLSCLRKAWFGEVEQLRPKTKAQPLRYGTAWHEFLEDLHGWWMVNDEEYKLSAAETCVWCGGSGIADPESNEPCTICGGSGAGPAARTRMWVEGEIEANYSRYDEKSLAKLRKMPDTLSRAIEGYLQFYGRQPYQTQNVVEVEVALSRPILNPSTGKPYCPETYVVEEPSGVIRLARTGEAVLPNARKVRWPWYFVGRLDALLKHRQRPVLTVYEGKSSGAPGGYFEGLSVDPQPATYAWLVEHALAEGLLPYEGEIGGCLYDVASSHYQYDPDVLKKGGLSKSFSKTVPSWRYRWALQTHGLDAGDYHDHIADRVAKTDQKLYIRESLTVGPEQRRRIGLEAYGIARTMAALRRNAARASDLADIDVQMPRVAVCRLPGGSCSYRGPCLQDGPEVREQNFEVGTGLVWRRGNARQTGLGETANTSKGGSDELGF